MTGRMSGRVEVVARVSGRRRWSVEQKLSILLDAFGPNGSVRDAVERHERFETSDDGRQHSENRYSDRHPRDECIVGMSRVLSMLSMLVRRCRWLT